MTYKSFHPTPRTLMGPGPSDVHPRVLAAMSQPTIGHLDPEFIGLMDDIKSLLRYSFQTNNTLTVPLSAPGSAGMEAAFCNLLEPGDKAIVCINGVFGMRQAENVRRMGGELVTVEDDWGTQVDPEKLRAALKANPDTKVVSFVHAETSTGVCSDVATLCGIAQAAGALTIVDSVTALGGIELAVDDWGADVVYSGTQKCLSCPPGISLITFSEAAAEQVKSRNTAVQSWFLDLSLLMAYWEGDGARSYHHTAPVNAMYGLYEALRMLHEEGLENAWQRHRTQHEGLVRGLEGIGLEFVVDADYRLPQLNVVQSPDGVDEAAVRKQLLAEFNLEIGAGLGVFAGKVWRIGLMGYAARSENVQLCISGLKHCLQ
ncbi:MAG: alanine--glyoxylate aminotransferase family protein [Pseudomonadales bacterium]|jgi:alanine-glyoxylate transaminase / serine-glyoxylate transaminase / serine-pyruvate transaminase|nr:alanine--glyoxylate aminotransferase family protein [Pseudomonadales bacterium]